MKNMEMYHYYFTEISDKRVMHLPFMTSPWPTLALLVGYLAFVLKIGPKLMENRKPFEIKWVLAVYNIFQVFSCLYIIYKTIALNPTVLKFWCCNDVDYSNNPTAIEIMYVAYITHILKVIELLETVFFVLRKKNSQVSTLHLYHHISTAVLTWAYAKYTPGGMPMFSVMLNSMVHVIMYTYYAMALFGAAFQRRMLPIKKSITMIQMIQFCIILVNTTLAFAKNCTLPRILLILYGPNIVLIFYMFYRFYKKSYTEKQKKVE